MDYRGGERVVAKNIFNVPKEGSGNKSLSVVYIISDSDHNVHLDNPKELSRLMISDILNTEQHFKTTK